MQVSVAEIGEATAGTVADGAVCKGNHQKAEARRMYVCLWTCKVDHHWADFMMDDDLRRGRSGDDASHTAAMSGRR